MTEEIIIEKKKRVVVRRKKEPPPFSRLEKKEGECFLNTPQNMIGLSSVPREDEYWSMCPFTEFIPVPYLFYTPEVPIITNSLPLYFNNRIDIHSQTSFQKRFQITRFNDVVKSAIHTSCYPAYIENYLIFDKLVGWHYVYNSHTTSSMLDTFIGDDYYNNSSYSVRTNSGRVGLLTLVREHTPEVVAVVLPENYLYQKLHLLKYNKLDFSKIIVLVNNQLDSTSHPSKAFRSMYMKHFLPVLRTCPCDVWRVPVSFIQEKCFVKGYRIQEPNIFRRKKAIEAYAKEFIKSAPSIGTITIPAGTQIGFRDENFLGQSYNDHNPAHFTISPNHPIHQGASRTVSPINTTSSVANWRGTTYDSMPITITYSGTGYATPHQIDPFPEREPDNNGYNNAAITSSLEIFQNALRQYMDEHRPTVVEPLWGETDNEENNNEIEAEANLDDASETTPLDLEQLERLVEELQ